ncbi:hypothetical protein KOR42_12230 [Thalassoglobus neptunius]|uniref:Uncharacterized protein n=1 Tax=Thalassoglobus neptunius TaxID=1938619 RepID=A0A5C5X4D2_9PLAN|nr:hypothetical protein [Thalassoglobus neptunius]TWT57856.1 hypothetical protein KOR42_12230 [Thalassoglobus neptunius]
MLNFATRNFKTCLLLTFLGTCLTSTQPVEAGVIPWTYNAIFGYGPAFNQAPYGYGSPASPAPMYQTGYWPAGNYYTGYRPRGGTWSPQPYATYYAPLTYTNGAGYVNGCNSCAPCSCSPCGGPCGAGGPCDVSGSASTVTPSGANSPVDSGANYSPEPEPTESAPAPSEPQGDEVVPQTFQEPEESDLDDSFEPVRRREDDAPVQPEAQLGPATTEPPEWAETGSRPSEVTPTGGEIGESDAPPFVGPEFGEEEGIESGDTAAPVELDEVVPPIDFDNAPQSSNSAPAENTENSSTLPPFIRSLRAPADAEPQSVDDEEADLVLPPEVRVEPLEIKSTTVVQLKAQRRRIQVEASTASFPALVRSKAKPTPIQDAGTTAVAVR